MTIRELVQALTAAARDSGWDAEVWLAVDEEGNEFKPVLSVGVQTSGGLYDDGGEPAVPDGAALVWPGSRYWPGGTR